MIKFQAYNKHKQKEAYLAQGIKYFKTRWRIVDIKIIPLDTAGQLINLDFYRSRFQNIIVFYAAVDYKVSNEDKYITNGTNYRLYVIVKQNDGYFIVEVSTAPLPIIKKLGIGFNTENEKKG